MNKQNWPWKYNLGDLVEVFYDGSVALVLSRDWSSMDSEYEPDTDEEGPLYTLWHQETNSRLQCFEYELNKLYSWSSNHTNSAPSFDKD